MRLTKHVFFVSLVSDFNSSHYILKQSVELTLNCGLAIDLTLRIQDLIDDVRFQALNVWLRNFKTVSIKRNSVGNYRLPRAFCL